MREKHVYYAKRATLLISCCAIVVLSMGMLGCTNDNPSHGSQNGISAPAPETPQNFTTYSVTRNRNSVILGGVSVQDGSADPLCGVDITVKDETNTYFVIDAVVELRWNVSDYPNRSVCAATGGTTYSLSSGVYHLYATTDGNGIAHFRVGGGYTASVSCGGGEGSASNPRKVRLFVDGDEQTISGGWCNVSTADLDNIGGVNDDDEDTFYTDEFCANYYSRSDFNGDGVVNGADLSKILSIINGGGSGISPCNPE